MTKINIQRALEAKISLAGNNYELIEATNELSKVSSPSRELTEKLSTYLSKPIPLVTAAVIRLFRKTGVSNSAILGYAAEIFTLENYNGNFPEEVIQAIGWANEFIQTGERNRLVDGYYGFLDEAIKTGDQNLIDFCRGYEVVREIKSRT